MYEVRFGELLLPVAPSDLSIKINGNNKTVNLVNDGEINILKKVSLTEISFDFLLPNALYPFATYDNNEFKDSAFFLTEINKLLEELKSFNFTIIRTMPSNDIFLFDTDLKMAIEDYSIKEDSKNGFDIVVSITLKQYKEYKTKELGENGIKTKREEDNSPKPTNTPKVYKVLKGDTLWAIAKYHYGDGANYSKIAEFNKLTNPNKISVGQVIKIPVI